MVRLVSLSVLLTLIVVLGITFFKVVAPFLLPLFLAAVFAILCQPMYLYFLARTKQRIRLAAGLTTTAIVSLILVPVVVGTILASLQLFSVATNLSDRNLGRMLRERTDPILQHVADFVNARTMPPSVTDQLPEGADADDLVPEDGAENFTDEAAESEVPSQQNAEPTLEGDARAPDSLPSPEDSAVAETAEEGLSRSEEAIASSKPRGPPVRQLTAADIRRQLQMWIRDSLSQVGSKSLGMAGGTLDLLSGSVVAVGSAMLGFAIFAVALYYFLADGTQLVRATERLIPVHAAYQQQMLNQFAKVVRGVVMATFFAALAQSVATVAALWLLGFGHLFVIFVVALLTSMIPMLGTWIVWVPCAGFLLYNGHWFQALLLAVYGSTFIALLDNIVRTYVLNTDVKLHPLLALISVLGGLQVMGLWGMFVGPIVASCLHALVKIFNYELTELSKEKFAALEGIDEVRADEDSPPPVIPTPPIPTVAKSDASGQNETSETGDDNSSASDT